MCQPYSPDCSRDFTADRARDTPASAGQKWRLRGLALAGLGALDIWLMMELAQSVGVALAQHDAPLIPALAAIGCALETGAALLLTWLLIDDGADEPAVFR